MQQTSHQLAMSTQDYLALKEGIEAIQKQNEEMAVEVLQIKICVSGNELDKNDTGMIGRVKKLEANQEKARKYIWMLVGGGVVITFILKYILH